MFRIPLALAACCLASQHGLTSAGELRILAWNVESGDSRVDHPALGSDSATIAGQLKQLADFDVVALSEVRPTSAKTYVDALSSGAGETFLKVISGTGGDDRVVLAWRAKRLKLLEGYEIHRFGDLNLNGVDDQFAWRFRSPLIGRFQDRESRVEFLFMAVHLAREDQARNRQAAGLRNWAARQTLPVIAAGDFNFDFAYKSRTGNESFQRFIAGDRWKWIEPEELIDTNWYDADPHAAPDKRRDGYPDSMLDFAFVCGAAKQWKSRSKVIVRPDDFPDSGLTSDHRPIAVFVQPTAEPASGTAPLGYPAHWWTPVTDPAAPDWEILPQAAGPGEVVLSKRHELGLLSNFAATPFVLRGKKFASVEGFWQAMLYPEGGDDPRNSDPSVTWEFTREQVEHMVGFEAKHAGDLAEANMAKLGVDWATFEGEKFPYRPRRPGRHFQLIVEATRAKVEQNPAVRGVLLSTGRLTLRPDHHQEASAPAAWHYEEILTEIRDTLSVDAR